MWIFSKHGFFSINQAEDGNVHIRARAKKDAQALVKQMDFPIAVFDKKNGSRDLPPPKLSKSHPGSDYPWRIILEPAQLLVAMRILGESVDYPNFKSMIAKTPSQADKGPSLHAIWGIMRDYQDGRPPRSQPVAQESLVFGALADACRELPSTPRCVLAYDGEGHFVACYEEGIGWTDARSELKIDSVVVSWQELDFPN